MMTSSEMNGRILKRASPSTIQNKFMVGYQGWFTCAGDGEPLDPAHHGWLHWFNHPIPDGGRPNVDLWPDVSECSPSELFPATGLTLESGEQPFLFSSRHPKTVQRHFRWMAMHGIDGAFLQRFAGQTDVELGGYAMRRLRDEVGDRVREAAESEGRVFAIMYDVSGVSPDRIQRVLERDWVHLVRTKGVLDSPNYLREKGKPVIALWGFGFENARHSPATLRAITAFFRSMTPGGAYLIAGTPAHWRTSSGDADRNAEFVKVWLNEFDTISPWTVGRYGNESEADKFAEEQIRGDLDLLRKYNQEGGRKLEYMPVVLPGGSGHNLSEGKWAFNDIKRDGGKFLWRQIFNVHRLGVKVIYGAMWDEYDEGTALMPAVEKRTKLPRSTKWPFLALDADGYDLPSDWYMRICGFSAEGLRSEHRIQEWFPSKELQDYWSTRPKYENSDDNPRPGEAPPNSGSGTGEGQSYQAWLSTQKDDQDEPPPPPYSLEADGSEAAVPQQTVISTPDLAPSQASSQSADIIARYGRSSPPSQSQSFDNSMGVVAATVPSLTDAFSRQTLSPSNDLPGRSSSTSSSVVVTQPWSPHHYMSTPPLTEVQGGQSASSSMSGLSSFASSLLPKSPSFPTPQIPSPGPSIIATNAGAPQSPIQEPQSHGSWSQGEWPPPDWKTSQPTPPAQTQPPPQRPHTRPPQHPQTIPHPSHGSGLNRPGSYNATYATYSSSRPRPPSAPPPAGTPPSLRPPVPVPNRESTLSYVYPGEFPPAHVIRTAAPASAVFQYNPQDMSSYVDPTNPYSSHATNVPGGYSNIPGDSSYHPPHSPVPLQQPYPQQFPQTQWPPSSGQNVPIGSMTQTSTVMPGFPALRPPTSSYERSTSPMPSANYSPYPPVHPASLGSNYPVTTNPASSSGTLGNALNSAADTLGLGGSTRRQLDKVAQTGDKLLNKFL